MFWLFLLVLPVFFTACEKKEISVTFYQGGGSFTFINTSKVYKANAGKDYYLYLANSSARNFMADKKTDSIIVSFNGKAFSLQPYVKANALNGTKANADFTFPADAQTGKIKLKTVAARDVMPIRANQTPLDSIPEAFVEGL